MKFVSFHARGRASYGYLTDGGVHDLGARIGSVLPDLKSYLAARSLGLAQADFPADARADFAAKEITLDPTIPNPGKILCIGLNYQEHVKETGRGQSPYPVLFTRFADTLIGHDAAAIRPRVSTALDYEGELAVVIGRAGFQISRDQALAHVAGYTCCNDVTVRDWQRHTHQFTPGKNFPATGALGPFLLTDELPNFADRRIETRLNGAVMQSATLGDMIFPVEELIEYISAFTPLAPGDVIATGTPGGVGFKRDPAVYMKAGDVVEVSIEGLGVLRNTICDQE